MTYSTKQVDWRYAVSNYRRTMDNENLVDRAMMRTGTTAAELASLLNVGKTTVVRWRASGEVSEPARQFLQLLTQEHPHYTLNPRLRHDED
jgi:hypothetical protein